MNMSYSHYGLTMRRPLDRRKRQNKKYIKRFKVLKLLNDRYDLLWNPCFKVKLISFFF